MISGQSPEDLHERRIRARSEEISIGIGLKAVTSEIDINNAENKLKHSDECIENSFAEDDKA